MPDWRDAYPAPTDGEPKPELARDDEDLWFDVITETAIPGDNPTRPPLVIHRHDLCGHECLSGACTGLEAICIACEYVQDRRR